MTSTALDDIFEFLALAAKLEEKDRIESATKYYEAVYLMRRYVERLPKDCDSNENVKQLLWDKADHYEALACSLIRTSDNDAITTPSDSISALTYSPRSPLSSSVSQNANANSRGQRFFPDDSSLAATKITKNAGSDRTLHVSNSAAIDNLASQANAKLAHALDLDETGKEAEAIQEYMEAAELYLKAMQAIPKVNSKDAAKSVGEVLKRRLEQTLDRVEELKHPGAKKKKNVAANMRQTQTPQQQHLSLTAEEIEILKRSSQITSGLFLPWCNQDAADLAAQAARPNAPLFTDPDGFLPLSAKQKERFHGWARPSEILRLRQQHAVLGSVLKPLSGMPCIVKSITPYTIQQKFVTDCSFIASLCICATFERRFRKRLITSILYPQTADGELMYNPSGKYMIKLWLNGVARCVVIDDYLPIDKKGNLLCSQTTNNSAHTLELWVCLIEKAYMKLCGGYDFPGSNSGVDLFSLTGWIPERVLFAKDPEKVKDYETPRERAWERIFSASSYGDCLITVSTQLELTEQEADAIGLVTGHAYAVLAVIQTKDGTRLLQLKNPWAHKGWRGRFSCHDKESWKSAAFRQEVGYNPDVAAQQDDGVFWCCWDDILHYFQNFHLSWNPALFRTRLTIHGCWPSSEGPADDTFNIGENPQYALTLSDQAIKKKATIWILISRHVTKQEQLGSEAKDFLTVHIHRNNKKTERIWYPGQSGHCVLTGCYTNNPHVLVRYDVEDPADKYLSLILSQYRKSNDLNYTVSCFCTESFHLSKPEKDLGHLVELSSTWSTYTAGGPVGQDGFISNPQFSIRVPETTTLQVRLSTSTTVAANVILVPVLRPGDPIEKAAGDPIIDTGKYRHGFVASEKKVAKAGNYTLVVSNYHPGQTGLFTLKLSSSSPKVKIEKIDRQ